MIDRMASPGTTPSPSTSPAPVRLDLPLLDVDVLTVDPDRPELRGAAIGVLDGRIAWHDAAAPPGVVRDAGMKAD
jgi:hypothetical protein